MQTGNYVCRSEFARRYIAQGRAEGKAEGRIEGEARALLRILNARGLGMSDAERAQIIGCADLATVEGWDRPGAEGAQRGRGARRCQVAPARLTGRERGRRSRAPLEPQ